MSGLCYLKERKYMHVKIESDGHAKGRIWVDGQEMKNVVSISAYLGVDELTRVTIEVLADKLEIDTKETKVETEVKKI
jgi:hypothetical protein